MVKIVTAPNNVLAEKAKEVQNIDKNVLKIIDQMKHALLSATDPIGVGLAAPQIGISLRIFITKPTQESPFEVFINPKIHFLQAKPNGIKKKSKTKKLEGCLSLPDIWGEVLRKPKLEIEYLDETGKTHKRKLSGFMATIAQHEMDHLDGMLFPKRVLEQKGTLYKSEKNKEGKDIFEEIRI